MGKTTSAISDRDKPGCTDDYSAVCPPLGNRVTDTQFEALVGNKQFVAGITKRIGMLDVNTSDGLDFGPITGTCSRALSDLGSCPWRIGQPLTGGMVAQWMRMEFTGLQFRYGLAPKSPKFTFPVERGDPRLQFG